MKYVINVLVSFVILSLVTFIIAKGLGNPFAGLGSRGYLSSSQVEELKKSFHLNENPLDFLASLLHGGPPSLMYGKPSLTLFLSYALTSFSVLVPSFSLAFIASALTALVTDFKGNKVLNSLAYVPEYLYAALLFLSSWTLGWPNPLPSFDPSKALAYGIIVFLVEFPKLLQGLIGLYEDSERYLEEPLKLLKAAGLPKVRRNLAILKFLMIPFISLSLYSFVMLAERSVLIEPFISFPGMGDLLYNAVVNADITLATTSFLAIGLIAIITANIASLVEKFWGMRT